MTRVHAILAAKVGTPQSGQSALVVGSNTILLKSQRYYPSELDVSKLPLLAATFGEASFSINYGHDADGYVVSAVQTITVWGFLNNMKSGAYPIKETLDIAEPITDAVKTAFFARTRLQLESDSDKLDCLTKDILLQNHSPLTVDSNNIGIISFSFQIEYDEYIERL